jgi:hypothetical protein
MTEAAKMIGVFDRTVKLGDVATLYSGPDGVPCAAQPVLIVRASSLEEYLKLYPAVSAVELHNLGFGLFFYEFLTD